MLFFAITPAAVKTPFSLFLSLRYLRPKRTFVSVITVISVAGVTVGVWILTTVIAVITGFNDDMRQRILGSQAHLTLRNPGGEALWEWPDMIDELCTIPGVAEVVPFVGGQAVLDFKNQVLVVGVLGLEARDGPIYDKFASLIPTGDSYRDYGAFDLSEDYAVIGRGLADGMGIPVGETIVIYSVANGREWLDASNEGREPENLIPPAELTVSGIFQSEDTEIDVKQIFVPLEIAQALFDHTGTVSGLQLELENPFRASVSERELARRFPNYEWESWIGRNRATFDAVAQERTNMYVLLFMITVVAAFCIMNTMITVTTQKRPEIGLMKAIGARRSQVVSVFLWQGILVGLAGSVIGFCAAVITLWQRSNLIRAVSAAFGMDPYDPAIALLWDLPARLTTVDMVVISAGSFLACAISALLPAYVAANLDAAKALRSESVT